MFTQTFLLGLAVSKYIEISASHTHKNVLKMIPTLHSKCAMYQFDDHRNARHVYHRTGGCNNDHLTPIAFVTDVPPTTSREKDKG